jgi:curved DNA-binding protein CbpA
MEIDPYAVLEVPSTATADEIRSAYVRQVRAHHPDSRVTQQSTLSADETLRRVVAAYTLLRDPERRARYDRERRAAAPRAPSEKTSSPNRARRVRIPGLAVQFRIKWLSG